MRTGAPSPFTPMMPPRPPEELYGIRKPKKTPIEISSTSDLAFNSNLSALISSAAGDANSSRKHGSRSAPRGARDDIFTTHKQRSLKRRGQESTESSSFIAAPESKRTRVGLETVDTADLARSTKKLKMKAKLYTKMKRGEILECEMPEGLVDFDAKWAEGQARGADDDSDSSEASDANGGELDQVEFEDEYGRLCRGTRAEMQRMERKKQNKLLGAEELGRLSARPNVPEGLIHGDAIQTAAFQPDEQVRGKMEELAARRDRSLTPPDMKHYEADKEYRIKGVGFYQFSKDEQIRAREMADLEAERKQTERLRQEREDRKAKKKLQMEQRLQAIGAKRAEKLADEFLAGLS